MAEFIKVKSNAYREILVTKNTFCFSEKAKMGQL